MMKRKQFVYAFRLLDLRTNLYVALGTSLRSERAAFEIAMEWLDRQSVRLESVRLNRFYSNASDVDRFEGAKVYVVPKKSASMKGSMKWELTMKEFLEETVGYLEEFYQRDRSEPGFSGGKRMLGWGIAQRREDRIHTAHICQGTWHNLLNL